MAKDFFNQLKQRLFPDKPEQGVDLPMVTEPLTRTEKFQSNYEKWLGSPREGVMLDILKRQWAAAGEAGFSNPAFQVYQSPQSNGFYFNKGLPFKDDEFRFMLDRFQGIVQGLGYRNQIAERRHSDHPRGVHCMERYYLKPELGTSLEPPISQIYGNVHLELVLLNEEASYLKVMAHIYQDRNYEEAMPFDGLVNALF